MRGICFFLFSLAIPAANHMMSRWVQERECRGRQRRVHQHPRRHTGLIASTVFAALGVIIHYVINMAPVTVAIASPVRVDRPTPNDPAQAAREQISLAAKERRARVQHWQCASQADPTV